MNASEAREIFELHKHLEKAINDPFLHTSMEKVVHQYLEAKGYLACLDGEEVKALHNEIRRLNIRIEQLSAEGYACGAIEEIGVFTQGCGKHVDRENSFRCVDCTASFHRECIKKHFNYHGVGLSHYRALTKDTEPIGEKG